VVDRSSGEIKKPEGRARGGPLRSFRYVIYSRANSDYLDSRLSVTKSAAVAARVTRRPQTRSDARRVVPPRKSSGARGAEAERADDGPNRAAHRQTPPSVFEARAQPSATHASASRTPQRGPEVHATPKPWQRALERSRIRRGAWGGGAWEGRSMGGEERVIPRCHPGSEAGCSSPPRSGARRATRPSSRRPPRRRRQRARAST